MIRAPTEADVAEDLRRFLNAYWLRPENAFWMVLRSHALGPEPWPRPSIDVSCGDGCFLFLHAGGAFDITFDVFRSVSRLDQVREHHADMFDHVDDRYEPVIAAQSRWSVDAGTDWKLALLDKAAALGVYKRLLLHDNNNPLPFETGSFRTVYCNAVYWVEPVAPFLRELRRITAADGRLHAQIKLNSLARYTLSAYRDVLGERWLDLIGRGRIESWRSLADRATWERRFAGAGFEVERATPFITRTHAHIWDIGLRPIAPLLVRMANGMTPESRRAIKAEWVDLFVNLLLPFTTPDVDLFAGDDEPAEIHYVLRPA
jgi:SAM-dependent methyltransferase